MQTGHVLVAVIIVAAALAFLAAAVLTNGQHTQPPAPGLVPTGWRYCPGELRQRAAVLHPDGSATCCDCGATIPPAGD